MQKMRLYNLMVLIKCMKYRRVLRDAFGRRLHIDKSNLLLGDAENLYLDWEAE
jgi:hypothetical protein